MKVESSDGETMYTVSTVDTMQRDNSIEGAGNVNVEFRQHRRSCKHIREAKKVYCGWREDKVYDLLGLSTSTKSRRSTLPAVARWHAM